MIQMDMDGGYAFFIFRRGARAPEEREGAMVRGGECLEEMELKEEILKIFEELIQSPQGDFGKGEIPEGAAAVRRGIFPRLAVCFERVCTSPRRRA
jgi:hypothetical protein